MGGIDNEIFIHEPCRKASFSSLCIVFSLMLTTFGF